MRPHRAQSIDHLILGRAVREVRAGAIERGEINPTFKVLLKLSTGLTVPLSAVIRLYEERREEAG